MKTERLPLQKRCAMIKPTHSRKLSKRKPKTKTKMLQDKITIHETIKTKCLERPEIFIDEEGDALGIPKL